MAPVVGFSAYVETFIEFVLSISPDSAHLYSCMWCTWTSCVPDDATDMLYSGHPAAFRPVGLPGLRLRDEALPHALSANDRPCYLAPVCGHHRWLWHACPLPESAVRRHHGAVSISQVGTAATRFATAPTLQVIQAFESSPADRHMQRGLRLPPEPLLPCV